MNTKLAATCAALALLTAGQAAADPNAPLTGEEAFTFTAASGESVEAFRGGFEVPENRADPDSRPIPIRYVRFPATGANPGSPIVYLAGGPGASGIGTAQRERFPLFMAMREFGDVIALDQRGVGESNTIPYCTSSVVLDAGEPYSDEEFADLYRQAAEECGAFWREHGLDITGYTTAESVQDLDALREHLGAEKITLWGISYGTHLALAALKDIDDRLDRVVLSSAEGLDQTVKLPIYNAAYFDRLQAAVNTQPAAQAAYPEIRAMMARVQARLDAEPIVIELPQRDGSTATVLVTRAAMQGAAARLVADPETAAALLALYAVLDQGGDLTTMLPPQLLGAVFQPSGPIGFDGMSLAMDIASGVSDERLALFEAQAPEAPSGAYHNFPMPQLRGLYGLDLGEEFRAAPVSDVPTLLLTGTLDGRTYMEEQPLTVAGLTDVTQVVVVNAGHNLFMTTPEITTVIQEFMRGEPLHTREIVAPLPAFIPEGLPPG